MQDITTTNPKGDLDTTELKLVRVIEIINPLDTKRVRAVDIEWEGGKPLADYMPEDGEWAISLNGDLINETEYDTLCPRAGDTIVCAPILLGGDGAKGILRMVAFIVLAIYAGPAAGAMLGTGASAASVAALTAGIMIAGSLLINAILPVQPNAGLENENLSESSTYGLNGPRNTASEGIAVPVPYGTHRVAGNIISLHTENRERTQIVYMLVNAGEGVIAGISDIRVNDQPIESFTDVLVQTRMGEADQDIIPWFSNAITEKPVGNVLLPHSSNWDEGNGSIPRRITSTEVDAIRFDLIAPEGLMSVDEETGKRGVRAVLLGFAYRRVADSAGTPIPGENWSHQVGTLKYTGSTGIYNYLDQGYYDPDTDSDIVTTPGGRYGALRDVNDYIDDRIIFDGNDRRIGYYNDTPNYETGDVGVGWRGSSRYPIRTSYFTPELEEGFYETAVWRKTAESESEYVTDKVHWENWGEIITDKVNFNHTALLAIRIRLSDQISGMPSITFINHGIRVRVWNQTTEQWEYGPSSNPAWIALDLMTNTRYGLAIPWGRIDLEMIQEWAEYCDAQSPKLECNINFDQEMAGWDALKYVFRAGHAQPVRVGTRYSVAIERAEDAVMMFHDANIVKDSMSVQWMPLSERANAVEISYHDRDDLYRQKTIKVMDPLWEGDTQIEERTSKLTLLGVTDRDRVIEEAHLHLRMNRHIKETVSFVTSIDAMACTVGSVINMKARSPSYSISGRIAAPPTSNTSGEFTLDQDFTFITGETYKALIHIPMMPMHDDSTPLTFGAWGTNSIVVNGLDDISHSTLNALQDGAGLLATASDGQVSPDCYTIERIIETASPGVYTVYVKEEVQVAHANRQLTLCAYDVMREVPVTFGTGGSLDTPTNFVSISDAGLALGEWRGWEDSHLWHFMLGKEAETIKQYRILSISYAGDLERHISAIEYRPEIYDNEGVIITTPVVPPTDISHVKTLTVSEDRVAVNNASPDTWEITVGWMTPDYGVYAGADVYAKVNTEVDWRNLGRVTSGLTEFIWAGIELQTGDTISFKVVSFDVDGENPGFTTAPTESHIVGSSLNGLYAFTNLSVSKSNLFQFRINWAVDNPEALDVTEIWYTYDPTPEVGTPVNNPEDAGVVLLAEVPRTKTVEGMHFDWIDVPDGTYRFWVRGRAMDGTVSEFYPTGGVVAFPHNSIEDILESISDSITLTSLDQWLRTQIELIGNTVSQEDIEALYDAIFSLATSADRQTANIQHSQELINTASLTFASDIQILQASLGDADAIILQEATVRAAADLAEAEYRLAMGVQLSSAIALAEQTLNTRIEEVDGELTAEVTSRELLASQITGSSNGTLTGGYILDERSLAITREAAIAQTVTDLSSSVSTDLGDIDAQLVIVNETVASIDEEVVSHASQITQLVLDVGDNQVALEQRLLVTEAQAAYMVRINAWDQIVGFGLGLENVPGSGPTSIFEVVADQFAISSPGPAETAYFPFVVFTVEGPNGEAPGVYMENAFIQNLSVDTIHISNGALTNTVSSNSNTVTIADAKAGDVCHFWATFNGASNQQGSGTKSLFTLKVNGATFNTTKGSMPMNDGNGGLVVENRMQAHYIVPADGTYQFVTSVGPAPGGSWTLNNTYSEFESMVMLTKK